MRWAVDLDADRVGLHWDHYDAADAVFATETSILGKLYS